MREVRQSEGRNLKANKKKTSDENVVLLLTATIQESTHDVSGLSSERPPTTAGPAPAVFFGSSILVQSGAKRGKSKIKKSNPGNLEYLQKIIHNGGFMVSCTCSVVPHTRAIVYTWVGGSVDAGETL